MAVPVRAPRIEALFAPHHVVAYSGATSGGLVEELRDEERSATALMNQARTAEFATARACARAALRELGVDAAVPRQDSGAPLWPAGVTGSISHARGFCVAIATSDGIAVGIDVEEAARMKPAVERRVLVDQERSHMDTLKGLARQQQLCSVFAAKEAFYKAHYEVDPRYLGFDAVAVEVTDFTLRFLPASGAVANERLAKTGGMVLIEDGRVIVGVVIDTTSR